MTRWRKLGPILEGAKPYELGDGLSWTALLRARALIRTGRAAADAVTELQKVLVRPLFAASPSTPLALLELARAQAEAGDAAASRRAYQDLLARWNDADSEIPVVEQAKAEYARLGQ